MTGSSPQKIKLLYLVNTLTYGGVERLLMNLCQALDKTQFDITVVYFRFQAPFADLLKDEPVEILNFSRNGKLDPFAFLKLVELIRRKRIDILHCHTPQVSVLGYAAKLFAPVCAFVITRHLEVFDKAARLDYRLEQLVARRADKVIGVSDKTTAYAALQAGVQADRLCTIYNGIRLADLPPKRQTLQPHRHPDIPIVIGTVGRLVFQKGFNYLIEAAIQLKRQLKNFRIDIIGDGELHEELTALIAAKGVGDCVRLLPAMPRPDLLRTMQQFDIFAMPSRWEGMSGVLMEAMALELPIVAADVSGVEKLLTHGKTGFVVPKENAEALATALSGVAKLVRQNAPELSAMGNAARTVIVENYSIDRIARLHESLYRSLLDRQN